MKVLQLTAGTGSYHCGTCIRDNALVKALRDLGHEAVLAPLYLPLVVDGDDCSVGEPLFLGGINTYLQQNSPLFRMAPRWINRLLDSRPLLQRVVSSSSMTNPADLGAMTLSMVRGLDGYQADEIRRLAIWVRDIVKPDVVLMSNGLLAGIGEGIREIAGVKVVCTLQSELHFVDGLASPEREQVWARMGEALARLDGVVAVSEYCREQMAERCDLASESIQVIYSGLDIAGFDERERAADDKPVLGYFARLTEEKGALVAVQVFEELRQRPGLARLNLDMGGSVPPGGMGFLKTLAFTSTIPGKVRIAPNVTVEQKKEFLRGVSVLCVPGRSHEVAGLYALEAMACGVPVVAAHVGGAGELVNATGGGLLYRAGDTAGMTDTLERLLQNPSLQAELGAKGREAVVRDYSAEAMAIKWLDCLAG